MWCFQTSYITARQPFCSLYNSPCMCLFDTDVRWRKWKKNKFSFKQEKSTLDTKNSYSEACIFRVFYNVLYIKGYSLIISFFHLNNLIVHVFAFLCCFILQLPNSFPNCNNWKVCFNVPWQEKKKMVGLEFVLFALLFGALTRAEKADCSSEHDKTEQPQFH